MIVNNNLNELILDRINKKIETERKSFIDRLNISIGEVTPEIKDMIEKLTKCEVILTNTRSKVTPFEYICKLEINYIYQN